MKVSILAKSLILALIWVGFQHLPANAQDTVTYLPSITDQEVLAEAVPAQEVGSPIFCRYLGRTIFAGEILCDVMYISLLNIGENMTPDPTPPPPPPPTPTPLPPGTFTVSSLGGRVEEPKTDCAIQWPIPWRACNIWIEFPDITTEACPEPLKMQLTYDDGMMKFVRIKGTTELREGVLWVYILPPMYDAPAGYEGINYTITVVCLE